MSTLAGRSPLSTAVSLHIPAPPPRRARPCLCHYTDTMTPIVAVRLRLVISIRCFTRQQQQQPRCRCETSLCPPIFLLPGGGKGGGIERRSVSIRHVQTAACVRARIMCLT